MCVSCRKGIYFRLDVYTTATDGRTLRRCSKQELKDQLLYIVEQTEGQSTTFLTTYSATILGRPI